MENETMRWSKERKVKVLSILLFAFLIAPNFAKNGDRVSKYNENFNFEKKNENEVIHNESRDDLPQDSTNEGILAENEPFIVSKENAAAFNITESVKSIAPYNTSNQKSLLAIDNANSTLEVPDGWDFEKQTTNISGLYKNWELIEDGNVT